jgi:glycosyltransferase involved in cell wall biosynthesis
MKVIFAIPYFYPAWQYGGQPRSAYELARALVLQGHEVKVLTTDSAGTNRLSESDTGINGRRTIDGVDVVYYRNLSNFLAYRQRLFCPSGMFRELERELKGAEVVHIHELRSTVSVLAYSAAKRLGIPFVLSAHGGLRHLGRRNLKILYDIVWGRRILRDASAVLAVSPIEEDDACGMRVHRSKVRRLPNAIAVSDYAVLPEVGAFQRRWETADRRVVLFLGRLHWIKGADLLLAAFSKVAALHPDIQLVLAGPDDGQKRQLLAMTSQFKLHDRVTFTGYLGHHEKLEALVDAAAVVIPSRSEVFALTAVEALICSRPVLMSSACGLFPTPGTEHGVLIFKSEDVDDLAARLSTLVSDTEFIRRGPSGRAFAASEFSSERIAKQAEGIYSDVLQYSKKVS